ncbi:MAG: HNH endonuclease [Proteobacteria bacterium]|nr:HNH endonuclease [Pseudomonadota bacterium]
MSVDSSVARKLPTEERRLAVQNFSFPLELVAVTDIRSLRLGIRSATVAFGQREGAIGGNPTKRLRLHLDWPAARDVRLNVLEAALGGPANASGGDKPELAEARVAAATKELRTRVAQDRPIVCPSGGPGGVRTWGVAVYYPRKDDVIAWVLHTAGGRCEVCGDAAPFLKNDGEPYLEVHHVRHLADGGPDQTDNAVAACPNCHRRLHFSADREVLRSALLVRVPRLVDYPKAPIIELPTV